MKKKLSTRIKSIITAGVTLITSSACGSSDVFNEPVYKDSPSVGASIDPIDTPKTTVYTTDTTTNTTATTTDTTYTTTVSDYTTEFYTTDEEVTDYIDTTIGTSDATVNDTTNTGLDTTYTTSVSGTTSYVDGSKYVDTTRYNETTKYLDTTKYTNTTTPVNTTRMTTTKATTAPNTTKATTTKQTTTKATTTKATTTTTEYVAPKKYELEDICDSVSSLDYFGYFFSRKLLSVASNQMARPIQLSYGVTSGGLESDFCVAFLNNDYIPDDIYRELFEFIGEDKLSNCVEFFYSLPYLQKKYSDNFDFSNYVLDTDVANYLNLIKDSYINGSFDEFMEDQIIDNNIDKKFLDNPAVMAYMSACDFDEVYLFRDEINSDYVLSFIDRVSGHSYKKN